MNIRFDLIMHWLYAIVWALLAISGFSMVGAKYGWMLSFDLATADYIHRIAAAIFVVLTFIAIIHEIARKIRKDEKPMPWFIIGRSGYQLFTFIIGLILIITGALIWIHMEFNNMPAMAFAMITHEYVSYIALASVIWHIYQKVHILAWPKKLSSKDNKDKGYKEYKGDK